MSQIYKILLVSLLVVNAGILASSQQNCGMLSAIASLQIKFVSRC